MAYLFRAWVDCGVASLSRRPGRSVIRRVAEDVCRLGMVPCL